MDRGCTHKKLVNIYIVYVINFPAYAQRADLILGMHLFGTVKLTKSPDFDIYIYMLYIYIYIYTIYNIYNTYIYIYIYSGYLNMVLETDFGFNARGNCSLLNGSGFGKNIVMSDADMN